MLMTSAVNKIVIVLARGSQLFEKRETMENNTLVVLTC
jgi:tmRNA-binding protein